MWRSLDNNNIGREGAFALAPALKDCRALRRLSIASNGIGKKGGQVILSGVKDCPTLIQLLYATASVANASGAAAHSPPLHPCR